MFFTKNDYHIFYGDLLFDFRLSERGPSVYENQQYIDIYLVRPCITEQHSVSFLNYKFEKEGEKKFEGGFRSLFLFLHVSNNPLETGVILEQNLCI